MKPCVLLFTTIILLSNFANIKSICQNHRQCVEFCQYCAERNLKCPTDCNLRWAEGCDNKCTPYKEPKEVQERKYSIQQREMYNHWPDSQFFLVKKHRRHLRRR